MDYRKKIYSRYVSENTKPLYGEITIDNIKSQFKIWDTYFSKFLPDNKKAEVIELGCGNGGLVYWLQNIGYSYASGIDTSGEQVACAKKFGVKNIIEKDLVEFMRDKKDFYDLIFLRDVLEHFKKDEIIDVMEMIYGSLKKGGKLIIQTPNSAGIFGSRYRYHDFSHEVSFTENSLRQIMLISNFSIVGFYETKPVAHGFKSLIRVILWELSRAMIKFLLLIETGSAENVLTQNIIAVGYKK
jgi:2-polyprenyl-3-methyl-5-hydroxy-6-metoxy-1,4-benzoquinol methylase